MKDRFYKYRIHCTLRTVWESCKFSSAKIVMVKIWLWLKALFSLLLLPLCIKGFCFYNVLFNTAFIHKGLDLNDVLRGINSVFTCISCLVQNYERLEPRSHFISRLSMIVC